MTDRIFVLHRADLPAALQLAAQLLRDGQCASAPVLTALDPVLHTHACFNGAPTAQLLLLPGVSVAAEAAARSLAASRLLCAEADELMATLIPEARGAAWCAFWLRTLHSTAFGCRSTGRALAARLSNDSVHLLVPELPHRYGMHSFLPALMYAEGLRAAGLAPKLFKNPLPPWESPKLPDPHTGGAGQAAVEVLCHLPTCFSDGGLFSAELLATGRPALVLPSPVYDVPTDGLPRCDLVPADQLSCYLSTAQEAALAAVLDRLGGLLSRHVEPLLGNAGLAQRQVQALLDAYRRNALLFFALEARFAARPPKTLLISNHDVGLHGAHLSFARRHGLHTVMVPHAKIFNSAVPSYGHDILCLTHPLQAGEVIDMDGQRLPSVPLDFAKPLNLKPLLPTPLRTLGLVLNGVSASSTCLVDLEAYRQGLQQLLAWCKAHGVDCRIRCRPSENTCVWLAPALGVPVQRLIDDQQGSLIEFSQQCDLVLGYDVPTSGVFDLLAEGLPVLQLLFRRLSPEDTRIVDPGVVPYLQLPQMLERLSAFHADAQLLWQHTQDQRRRYTQACLGAQPMRTSLL